MSEPEARGPHEHEKRLGAEVRAPTRAQFAQFALSFLPLAGVRQGEVPSSYEGDGVMGSLLGVRHSVALMGCVIHEEAPRSGALPAMSP